MLRTLGMLAILGGIFWGAYLWTLDRDIVGALQQNHGPVAIIALGVVVSLLGKYVRV